MSFYQFRQNNSGGSFWHDANAGITTLVIIEADSADAANDKAESIGIYFNGVGDYVDGDGYDATYDGVDCPTCGDRWWPTDESVAAPVPSNYGVPLNLSVDMPEQSEYGRNIKWAGNNTPEIYVHYADGRVEGYWYN